MSVRIVLSIVSQCCFSADCSYSRVVDVAIGANALSSEVQLDVVGEIALLEVQLNDIAARHPSFDGTRLHLKFMKQHDRTLARQFTAHLEVWLNIGLCP